MDHGSADDNRVSPDENGLADSEFALAGTSTNHSLALINVAASRGEAGSTASILELETLIRTTVRERFGIELEREPVLLSD